MIRILVENLGVKDIVDIVGALVGYELLQASSCGKMWMGAC